ncbi:amidase signature enzyme [Podospora aff. communis PSN243]|uniref:Amidase signature enzyme n=1 Tax=Podospora aff. communis PSN243 TaxID=3040156 RepID=A0AAV9GEH6_9PEZI|nr:amidase signature enzyme [Podospora aff. communis PSN243]
MMDANGPQMFTTDTGGSFLVHPQALASWAGPGNLVGVKPFMVLSSANPSDLFEAVSKFSQVDDVFSSIFLTDIVGVLGASKTPAEAQNVETRLGPWTVKYIHAVTSLQGGEASIPPGPYFLQGNTIHQAWKLYPDTLDAFSVAAYPKDVVFEANVALAPLPFLDKEGIWKAIATPSRLYSTATQQKPLAGRRIAVKDNFQLAGVKSTFSSRPYEATYGPYKDTALLVQKLIKLGAVIVGKTTTSAFASAEEPTDQWVDFHAPFNPRGDGYQSPAGSSNGAAAALSGYDIGQHSLPRRHLRPLRASVHISSDLNGGDCTLLSVRRLLSFILSFRGLESYQPTPTAFDAVGLLGRDLGAFHQLAALTVEVGAGDVKKYPKRILYPTDFLPYTEEPVQAIVEEFTVQLEKYLGVSRETINIAEIWDKNPPPEGKGKTIKEFLDKTGFYPFYYDGYNVNKQFLEDHRTKYGKDVYFGPYMRWKMETGSQVTLEQKEQGLREGAIYRRWFAKNILRQDKNTASDAVLVMRVSCYAPDYRDNIHNEPAAWPAYSENYLASILRMPQLVLPVGQVPYESTASGRREYHPITASLVGAEGSDLMLINLTRETFAHAGWGEKLLTGRFTWKLGDGVRNVDDAATEMAIQGGGHDEL